MADGKTSGAFINHHGEKTRRPGLAAGASKRDYDDCEDRTCMAEESDMWRVVSGGLDQRPAG
jgi:hypothetical protein